GRRHDHHRTDIEPRRSRPRRVVRARRTRHELPAVPPRARARRAGCRPDGDGTGTGGADPAHPAGGRNGAVRRSVCPGYADPPGCCRRGGLRWLPVLARLPRDRAVTRLRRSSAGAAPGPPFQTPLGPGGCPGPCWTTTRLGGQPMKLTHSDVQKWATEIADGVDDLVVGYLADGWFGTWERTRSEEHTSELQSRENLVCRLLLEKKKQTSRPDTTTS